MLGENRNSNGKKVVVAMSGGVDSSVAAAVLKDQGYEVVGCFMRLGSDDSVEAAEGYDNIRDCDSGNDGGRDARNNGGRDARPTKAHKQGCCSLNDASDARLVAARLDVPFYVLNFKKDFGRIINYFVDEYNAGRTPNPCIRCNDWLKFGKLRSYADSIGADYVASGHYARIGRDSENGGNARLMRGVDLSKDQSYVLFGTSKDDLNHMLLPIGDMQKSKVRQLAQEYGLPVFNKPDSQEICFVPDNDYARLVKKRSPDQFRKGDIKDSGGNVVGTHQGQQHFTIGQRRGVGVALGYPVYVTDKNPVTNTVTIGKKEELLSVGCTANQTNWLVDAPQNWRNCRVKVRYNSAPVPGKVKSTGSDEIKVRFDQPISAVTPGQAIVCYIGEQLIGGGWIDTIQNEELRIES